jgi:hypothetical protein
MEPEARVTGLGVPAMEQVVPATERVPPAIARVARQRPLPVPRPQQPATPLLPVIRKDPVRLMTVPVTPNHRETRLLIHPVTPNHPGTQKMRPQTITMPTTTPRQKIITRSLSQAFQTILRIQR